jgi:hypothetical protein
MSLLPNNNISCLTKIIELICIDYHISEGCIARRAPMYAICFAHVSLLHLVIIITGEDANYLTSHYAVFSSLLSLLPTS